MRASIVLGIAAAASASAFAAGPLGCEGCEEDRARESAFQERAMQESRRAMAPSTPSAIAERLAVDAANLAVPIDPPPPAGDLRAELDAFTTLDACVAQRQATLDALVGDAIRAIGYETFLRDACRMLQAAKTNDANACEAIDANGLRARCRTVMAMVTGAIERCPWAMTGATTSGNDDPKHAQGRDATCIAVISRDPRPCASELHTSRATCEALATRDEASCAHAESETAQQQCKRELARWKRVLEAQAPPQESARERVPASDAAEAHASLALHGVEGTVDPTQTTNDVTPDVARGAVLRSDVTGRVRFDLGLPRELGATVLAPPPNARARIAASILMDAKGSASLEHLEIDVPGSATLVCPGVRCDCRVDVSTAVAKRGGNVKLAIEGTLGVSPHAYKIRADITTFTRDLVGDSTPAPTPARGR